MDSATHSYAVYSPMTHPSPTASSWHHSQLPAAHSTALTPGQEAPIFSVADRPPDLEYPSPAPSIEQYVAQHQSPTLHLDSSNNSMFNQFVQVDSNVGPNRVLTRRQRALQQGGVGRRASLPSNFQRPEHDPPPRQASALYSTPSLGTSRLLASGDAQPEHSQRERLSLHIASAVPLQLQSPTYHPMTPTSMSSPSYSYQVYGHSKSTSASSSNNHRASSPALSTVSALTSVSSTSGSRMHGFQPYARPSSHMLPTLVSSKTKQKKQRLDNNARKNICLYQIQHPNARQEDIATVFKVERSTISKILKHKNKWLNMPDNLGNRVAKHRPSKFPEIEDELIQWLEECSSKKIALSDNSIRTKAKETARMLHISEEKFKASSGWVENFKTRHGIRAGIWSGAGKLPSPSRVLLGDAGEPILSPLNPAFNGRSGGANLTSSHDDTDAESDSSPEPEQAQPQDSAHLLTDSPSLIVQTPWTVHSHGTASSARQHILQPGSSLGATGQVSPVLDHQSPTHLSPRLVHAPSHHCHTHELERHQYIDQPSVYYPASIPEPRLPTLVDAEDAINTLITFLDTTGQGILEDHERRALNTIKCALFQAGSGVPFDRSRH